MHRMKLNWQTNTMVQDRDTAHITCRIAHLLVAGLDFVCALSWGGEWIIQIALWSVKRNE